MDEQEIYRLFTSQADAALLPLIASTRISTMQVVKLKEELDPVHRLAAQRVALEPDRLVEALHNLDRFHHAISTQKLALGDGTVHAIVSATLSRPGFCPCWPIC